MHSRYILAEKYNSIQSNLFESNVFNSIKEKILGLFHQKASNGIIKSKSGDAFNEDMVAAGLEVCANEETIDDFANFLGLAAVSENATDEVVEETGGTIAPEEAHKIITDPSLSADKIEVQTHFGDEVLPIVEIWVQDGTIKIAVEQTKQSA